MRIQQKTVLLLGESAGAAYRPAFWATYFMERSSRYSLLVDTTGAFSRAPKLIRWPMRFWVLLTLYLSSDIIVLQPMQHYTNSANLVILLNRLWKKRIIVDIYISAYETLVVDRKRLPEKSKKAKILKNRDVRAFTTGSPVIFLTEAEKKYYCKTIGLLPDQISSKISPLVVPLRNLARRPFLKGKSKIPTIAWWGNEGNPLHGFENIAEACRILIEEGFEARFAFFAGGNQNWDSFVEEFSFLKNNSNVIFTNSYTFANGKLNEFLHQETDLSLGTFGDTAKARTVLVNKVLDAASFGLPCLTQYSEGMLEFFEPDKNIFISEITPQKIAEKIRRCLSMPDTCLELGDASRALVRSQFSPESFQRSLGAIFEDL